MIKYEILENMKKSKGISWSYLESIIGGYRGKFVDYKKGKTTFSDEEEKKIASALATTVEYLSGTSQQKNKPAAESDELGPKGKAIWERLKEIDAIDHETYEFALKQLEVTLKSIEKKDNH